MRLFVQRWLFIPMLLIPTLWVFVAPSAEAASPKLFKLPAATRAAALAVASDGAIWFNGIHGSGHPGGPGGFIGHMGVDGALTEFPLPNEARAVGTPVAASP
jgi:streptogramin lyase